MDPLHVLLDGLKATAGSIMFLRQVLQEHPSTKAGVVPRDFLPLRPRERYSLTVDDLCQVHLVSPKMLWMQPIGWPQASSVAQRGNIPCKVAAPDSLASSPAVSRQTKSASNGTSHTGAQR
jgi:hypothetical protein